MGYVLIVGAKSDIGRALAHEYLKNGYDLYLAARNVAALANDLQDYRLRYPGEVRAVEFDLLDYDSHAEFYAQLSPPPVGVICVAGYLGEQGKAQTDFAEAARIIATNYTGWVSLLNIVANDLAARQTGFLVGIGSVAGDRGRRSNYIYGSAKAAFATYLAGLRQRLAAVGVAVLTVKPGFVRTQMTAGLDLPEKLTATPEEVARDIFRAQQRKKNLLYSKWFWRWIMLVITHIPENIFKRMKL